MYMWTCFHDSFQSSQPEGFLVLNMTKVEGAGCPSETKFHPPVNIYIYIYIWQKKTRPPFVYTFAIPALRTEIDRCNSYLANN